MRRVDRPWNTALFTLRAVQVGLSVSDLDRLEYGQVMDIIIEAGNDNYNYPKLASQEDFDRF